MATHHAPPTRPPAKTARTKPPRAGSAAALLERVSQFYATALAGYPEARQWLHDHGIRRETIEVFRIGYAAGTLVGALPEDETLRVQLAQLGILDGAGNEALAGSVTIPIEDPRTGGVTGLYGRRLDGAERWVPATTSGLVNRVAVRQAERVIVTANPLDAAVLHANGFVNAIGLGGRGTDPIVVREGVEANGVREVFVIRLEDGDAAAPILAALAASAVPVHPIALAAPSLLDYFERCPPEELEGRLAGMAPSPGPAERPAPVRARVESDFEVTPDGFVVMFGERRYAVKGIVRAGTQLRVVLKAERASPSQRPSPGLAEFELTTLDLYSARHRRQEAKVLAALFEVPEPLVRDDLLRLIEKAEKVADDRARAPADAAPELTPEEEAAGLALLADAALERRIVEDLGALGLVGEETSGLLACLVATSRKLAEPLSLIVQSRSGAGKSTLQDAVLALVPPEDVKRFTRITSQALFYQPAGGLRHKLLALEEAEGMGGAVYSIRALQSAGAIQILATGKNATTGAPESHSVRVEGPVAVFMTTTRTSAEIDGELASRNLFVAIDESPERTAAILARQRERMTLDALADGTRRAAIQRVHWAAQRLLRPVQVVNPFATQIRFPVESLTARRDQSKYLALIRSIAFLRQRQREAQTIEVEGERVEYVEVLRDDVALANRIAAEVLGHSLDELSRPSRRLLDEIRMQVEQQAAEQGVAPHELVFTRRDVRAWTRWSDFQVKAHVRELVELEYLLARQGERGKEYRYVLAYAGEGEGGARFVRGLVDPASLVEARSGGAISPEPALVVPENGGSWRAPSGGWSPLGGSAFSDQVPEIAPESREVGGGGPKPAPAFFTERRRS